MIDDDRDCNTCDCRFGNEDGVTWFNRKLAEDHHTIILPADGNKLHEFTVRRGADRGDTFSQVPRRRPTLAMNLTKTTTSTTSQKHTAE